MTTNDWGGSRQGAGRKPATVDQIIEGKARKRVSRSPKLQAYEDIIFYDWPNWDEHMRWIATAPISEIVSWAETVEA